MIDMKKQLSLLTYLFALALMASFTSCESDDEETCDDTPLSQCPSADIATCCPDDGDCYYIYNGDKYTSKDDIVALCKPKASAQEIQLMQMELDKHTMQLLDEARSAAICN
jgi:hypothetical protein